MLKINQSAAAIPAQDIKRARIFYEETLGLKPSAEESDGSVFYTTGETRFFVFPSQGKASGDHTQLGLDVDDIDVAANEVRSKGVKLEEYDYPDFKTKNGIADIGDSRGFWIKDTEGNLIAVMENAPSATTAASRQGSTTSR